MISLAQTIDRIQNKTAVVRHRRRLHADHRDRQQSRGPAGQFPDHGQARWRSSSRRSRKKPGEISYGTRRHRHCASSLRRGAQQGRRHRARQRALSRRRARVQRSPGRARAGRDRQPRDCAASTSRAGDVRLLTVFDTKRYAKAPDVPTITEVLPAYQPGRAWVGFLAPRDLPAAITTRLHDEIVRILKSPEVLECSRRERARGHRQRARRVRRHDPRGCARSGTRQPRLRACCRRGDHARGLALAGTFFLGLRRSGMPPRQLVKGCHGAYFIGRKAGTLEVWSRGGPMPEVAAAPSTLSRPLMIAAGGGRLVAGRHAGAVGATTAPRSSTR